MLGFCAGFGIQDLISYIQFYGDFLPCMCFKIFEQFVKTRIKEEYKERKSKLLLAKEEFKKLLEESKVSPRYGERDAPSVFWGQKCVIIAELHYI